MPRLAHSRISQAVVDIFYSRGLGRSSFVGKALFTLSFLLGVIGGIEFAFRNVGKTNNNLSGNHMRKLKTIIGAAATLATAVLFATSASASVLTSKLSVDNGYTVYISTSDNTQGTSFGAAEDWNHVYSDTTTLAAGTDYYIHIAAYDMGGMAGALGEFSLAGTGHHFANGTTTLTTDTTWWLGNNSGFSSPYVTLSDLGANGVGPWGSMADISSTAHWIWAGDANANDRSYLTARILADAGTPSNDVPEPASLTLMGAALLAMGRARSRRR